MEPTIPVGSLLFLKKLTAAEASQLHTGDVVTFRPAVGPSNVLITHRIVAIRHTRKSSTSDVVYTTKGDANQSADLTALDPSRIVGVYTSHVPVVGRVVEGFGQWRVVALIVMSLLLAQIALEQSKVRGMHTKETHQ
jgi:signal peptidase I